MTTTAEPHARLTAWVTGSVQGVGFRWWTRSVALELGLAGSATNLADGRVEIVAEGAPEALGALLQRLDPKSAPVAPRARPGTVRSCTHQWGSARGLPAGFHER